MKRKNDETPKAGTNEVSILSATSKELTMKSIATQISTINVPFHGASLFIVNFNGEPYTPMKPIVEGMGITWQGQLEKIKSRFPKGVTEIVIPSAGGSQSMTCLALRKLNGWLQTINPNKVKPEIRDNVIQYQEECDDVLYDYWTKGEAANPRKATTKCLPGKVNAEQQEAIKQVVLNRGRALPKDKQAKAIITMWSALKTHFGCSYKDIDGEQFVEALSLATRIALDGEYIAKGEPEPQRTDISTRKPPSYRYLVCMTVEDYVTGQTEVIKGGANSVDEIINGTAKKFGMHIFGVCKVFCVNGSIA